MVREDLLEENVFLFVPNLIGYARIILALVSFHFMDEDPIATGIAYSLSAFLDAFDGFAARALNQSTRFGSMLDQLTDRLALLGLLVTLTSFYPQHRFLLLLSIVVDIASHWSHIWVMLLRGKTSHKLVDASENPVLRVYYSSKAVLFTMCAGNEAFYGFLYLMHFYEGPIVPIAGGIGLVPLIVYATAPIAVIKSLISVVQLMIACTNFAIIDVSERVTERAKRSK